MVNRLWESQIYMMMMMMKIECWWSLESSDESDVQSVSKHIEDDVPYGAWWKKQADSLYSHAKEANTFWSIFIAAAVMGLVIIGQQWQQERWQVLHHKWHSGIYDEAVVLCQLEKAKEDMLNKLYSSISSQTTPRIKELFQEDGNVE